MQQIQYFKSAWGDIKNSPGWFGKLCLLALINFIPIFGQIVTFGYLYGWAREIAWGTHEPMPTRIFGNEDGKLYRRGWFILVLVFVAALIPSILMSIGGSLQGAGLLGIASKSHAAASSLMSGVGFLLYLVGLVGLLLLSILAWIGSMRISIYDRLSAGFQFGKIWKMFRHDTGGVMRIFGMDLLVGLIIGIVLSIIYTIVIFLIVFAGIAGLAASGYNVNTLQHLTEAQAMALFVQFIISAGIVGLFGIIVLAFFTYVASVFIMLLVARAMGYWTMQFDVPHWRGQDDPMPFETAPPAAAAPVNPVPPVAAPAPYDSYNQAAQPVQPTQPVQQAQAVQPVQPVQAVQPAQQTQPVQPVQQVQPAQQAQPEQQVQPTQPVQQVQPEQPVQAVTPMWVNSAEQAQPAPDGAPESALASEVSAAAPEVEAPVEAPVAESPAAEAPATAAPSVEELAPEAPAAEAPVAEESSIAPGQLSGFTYTGASSAPAQVTPSGADPSNPIMPDVVVVVPETPAVSGENDDEE